MSGVAFGFSNQSPSNVQQMLQRSIVREAESNGILENADYMIPCFSREDQMFLSQFNVLGLTSRHVFTRLSSLLLREAAFLEIALSTLLAVEELRRSLIVNGLTSATCKH